MISPAVFEFMSWVSTLDVVPLIKELRSEAETIRRHEISRALKRLDLSPEEEKTLEKMSQSLVNKLLHGPIQEIKARAERASAPESNEIRRHLLKLEEIGIEFHSSESP